MTISRSRRPKFLMRTVGALVAAVTVGGAALAETKTDLVWSHPQEPPNWNFLQTGATALTAPTLNNVIEGLVERLGDGSVAPLLAESWEISDDGLAYTFHLRDAKFHDGSDLDAGDVVYSILKNKDAGQSFIKVPLVPVEAVEAIDDRTVKITLSAPSQRLLGELGVTSGIIVPEGFYEEHDAASEMIGTGPYVFGEYRPDVHLILNRFDEYWGDLPYFEKITHRFIPDETAAINALLAGEIDMVASIFGEGLDRVASVAGSDEFKAVVPAPDPVNWVFLSTQVEALKDIRVRQAIAHAINRDDILAAGQSGYGETICQHVIPFTEPWNNGYCPYEYDPEKSRALLKEAGYENLTLDFPYLTIAEFPVIKDILEVQMADVGITLETRGLDLATWLERAFRNGEYEFSNITGVANAQSFICGGGREPFGMDHSELCLEEFDELVRTSDTILDRDAYLEAMAEMVKVLADSAWVIDIHAKSTPTLAREELVGHKGYRYRAQMDARKLRWAE